MKTLKMKLVVFSNLHLSKMIRCSSLLILILLQFLQTCDASCTPSACGIFPNISSPFRLKGDPKNCGDRRFELVCENNVTSIYLSSHKYYVKAINYSKSSGNYDTSTIRLVDAVVNNDDICSFPNHSTYAYNFIQDDPHRYPYQISRNISHLNFMKCPHPLKNSSLFTEVTDCASNAGLGYTYVKVGRMKASEVTKMCRLDVIVMTSWEFKDSDNVSLSEIHDSLLYGFELTICPWCKKTTIWVAFTVFFYNSILPILLIVLGLLLAAVSPSVVTIIAGFFAVSVLFYFNVHKIYYVIVDGYRDSSSLIALISTIIICAPRIIIFPIAVWFMIYKFRRKRLSIFAEIESFLQSDNKLKPIRYSYSDLKKMTRGFQDKLGEGGFGSVYKGKLRSGHHVAVKVLGKSGGNGQDFMNEIATIGRIHHVNVVQLVGYCAQGSKRALVYDYMPNGSLDKYLPNREKVSSMNWDTKFEVAAGVARGIEYLHRGCDVQILHFDIKPHNILLDEKFVPKVSDFGLAKLCSVEKDSVTMTAVRGTIGYVAPELISRSIGAVSYKADVYSFGMLLMEMLGLNRDLKGSNDDSNQYFPYWIYECLEQGKDIEIGKANENEDSDDENDSRNIVVRKMTIVALWCIQMSPDDRPSMNKVLKMLEGDVERLQIPESPSQSTQIEVNVDESGMMTYSSDSVSLLHPDDASLCVEITVQD